MTKVDQYILMPVRGLAVRGPTGSAGLEKFFASLTVPPALISVGAGLATELKMRVLDSIQDNGAKLVEASPEAAAKLRTQQPGMRLVPVVYYREARAPRMTVAAAPKLSAGAARLKVEIKVTSRADGSPVAGAELIALTDVLQRTGAVGRTDTKGKVALNLPPGTKVRRLYVYPEKGFWSLLRRNVQLTSGLSLLLRPLDLSFTDALRHFYGASPATDGAEVTVGVIDSGINRSHPDLKVDGGLCTVLNENPNDFGDAGSEHGTHVGGIIAARGTPPTGLRGVAPGVRLRSYRVFGRNNAGASNFAIAKAIDAAVRDGCDLINMSLGGGVADHATSAAIEDARAAGCMILVANGNDHRSPVSFPASDSMSIAVSAMGRKGTFPADSTATGDVAGPFGKPDKKNFLAAFSNIGSETDVTGPGVDILSTVPGGYAPMSGTSMACPAATGALARLLANSPATRNMKRDMARSDAIAQLLFKAARPQGFGLPFEGRGLP